MQSIPCPIHPDDARLPRSNIRLRLCGGEMVEILGVPIQGVKTLENILATLELWKPNIVKVEAGLAVQPRTVKND